jgi:hypothetical protein
MKYLLTNKLGSIALIGMSYAAAVGLRLIGTTIYFLTFHRSWGILGRPWDTNLQRLKRKSCGIFWRGNEDWMRNQYSRFKGNKPLLLSLINRENIFMHLTGLSSMSFLILSFFVYFSKKGGLARFIGVSKIAIIVVLLIMSFIFLLGHYRHTYQKMILEDVKPLKKSRYVSS